MHNATGMNLSMHEGRNKEVFICSLDTDNLEHPSSEICVTHLQAPTSQSIMSISYPQPNYASHIHLYPIQPNCYAIWCDGTSSLLVVDSSQSSPRVAEIQLSVKCSHLFAYISPGNQCK